MSSQNSCQSCSAGALHELAGFSCLPRVTSDSKPFRPGGRLFVCERCGLIQKIVDQQWRKDTDEIYRDYEMYHQSGSHDQPVFDPLTGWPSGRCEVLARRLAEEGVLPASGSLLDVGAGSGAMLAAFSSVCRGWSLFGLDLDDRKEQSLRAIAGFERLFTVPPEQVARQFDLITLIHSLEHFPDPLRMLRVLREKLANGRLFVQVNNVDRTPFDLVVADHLCHFTPRSLADLVARAGFRIEAARTDWVSKEISLLGVPAPQAAAPERDDSRELRLKVENEVAWLGSLFEHARESAAGNRFGIFGTSVAATWLTAGLGNDVEFFVDEDPAREGRTHLGRPILRPDQIPADAVVYLAFVPEVSELIRGRLGHLPAKLVAPSRSAS